jgi:hypothetical protein
MQAGKVAFSDLVVLFAAEYGSDVRLPQSIVSRAFPVTKLSTPITRVTPWHQRDEAVSVRRIAAPQLAPYEKLAGTVLCPPVLDAAYVPIRSLANDQWCVEKRIDAVRNASAQRLEFNDKYSEYATEFARQLIPLPHQLFPIEIQDVVDAQSRPTQVANNRQALPFLAEWYKTATTLVKSFQKGEVFAEMGKDPRNISTLPTAHCLFYSTYTRPMAVLLKMQSWYAFGLHPMAIARRVHHVAATSRTLTETDFSRFDGTHSHALYTFELGLLLRAYPPGEHDMIRRVHEAMTSASARTAFGVKYEPDGGRLSGAADTSLMNSIDNAFVAFCTYRQMGQDAARAYMSLGIYGGDDGLSADADPKMYGRVATDLGLRLKATTRPSHLPASFLGRHYPQPASDPTHMADLPRQLCKLHVHADRTPDAIPHGRMIALVNKATGHLITDSTTPILSQWCRAILRLVPAEHHRIDPNKYSWLAKQELEFGECNSFHPSPEIAYAHAASVLDISVAEVQAYCRHLDELKSLDDLPLLKTPVAQPIPPDLIVGMDVGVAPPGESKLVPPCIDCGGPNAMSAKYLAALATHGHKPSARCTLCRAKRKAEKAAAGNDDSKRSTPSPKPSGSAKNSPSVVTPRPPGELRAHSRNRTSDPHPS